MPSCQQIRSNAAWRCVLTLFLFALVPAAASAQLVDAKACYTITTDLGDGFTAYINQTVNYAVYVSIPTGCRNGSIFRDYEALTPGLQFQPIIGANKHVAVSIRPGAYRVSKFRIDVTVKDPFNCFVWGTSSKVVTLNVADGVDNRPDLEVESIDTPTGTVYDGDSIDVIARVRNTGAARASGTLYSRLRLNGASKGTRSCSNLNSGSFCSPQWNVAVTEGLHVLEVCADDGDRVDESDEGNNCESELIQVEPRRDPDLVISLTSVSPLPPVVGEEAQVRVGVRNVGQSAAGGFTVALALPGDNLTATCPGLAVNQECVRTFPWTPDQAGMATVTATADSTNAVRESNENNNSLTGGWNVEESTPVDLAELYFAVDGITMAPADPEVGDTITFTFRMHNSGVGVFGSPFPEMYITGSGVNQYFTCSEGIPNAGDCVRTWSIQATSAGNQSISAIADPFDRIPEEVETNNARTLNYVVADSTTQVTCQGTWLLQGVGGNTHNTSSQGSVVDDCFVYFAQNSPTGCMLTSGSEGLTAVWYRSGPGTCPNSVTVTAPDGETFDYSVTIY